MDGADVMAEAKKRLDAAERAGSFNGVVKENTQWWNAFYDKRENGRIFRNSTGTKCTGRRARDISKLHRFARRRHQGGHAKVRTRRFVCVGRAGHSALEQHVLLQRGFHDAAIRAELGGQRGHVEIPGVALDGSGQAKRARRVRTARHARGAWLPAAHQSRPVCAYDHHAGDVLWNDGGDHPPVLGRLGVRRGHQHAAQRVLPAVERNGDLLRGVREDGRRRLPAHHPVHGGGAMELLPGVFEKQGHRQFAVHVPLGAEARGRGGGVAGSGRGPAGALAEGGVGIDAKSDVANARRPGVVPASGDWSRFMCLAITLATQRNIRWYWQTKSTWIPRKR